jgi:hypothetical protein
MRLSKFLVTGLLVGGCGEPPAPAAPAVAEAPPEPEPPAEAPPPEAKAEEKKPEPPKPEVPESPPAPPEPEPEPVEPAPEARATGGRPPLPDAEVARTIDRIGYRCGSVVSAGREGGTAAGEPVYRINCSSGETYRGTTRRGRLFFRPWDDSRR